jgi:hypothetical protein
MLRLHRFVPFALPLVGTAVLCAQQLPAPSSVPAPASSLVWPTDRVVADVAADGSIRAATADWKVGFGADGATFHTFAGGDAPPVAATFALRAATAGEQPLAVGDAMPSLAGQRVTYERGAVRELFDLRTAGIEQMFVLGALPNRHDLTLDVAVTTSLAHRVDGDAHAFTGAHGGVRYGAALAIDANGRRLDVATTWTGGALRITVPASFLATAALPLLVDPLIGPIVPATTPSVDTLTAVDIAWDASLGQYFVVYERAFAQNDHDVHVAVLDAALQPHAVVTIDDTSADWRRPRVATLEAHDVAGVVAQVAPAGVAPFTVQMRIVTAGATPAAGAAFAVASALGTSNLEPDVGGDADPTGPSRFLVAWEETASINDSTPKFRTVAHGGAMGPTRFLGGAIDFERRVAISKTCGTLGGGTECWALVHRAEGYQQTTGQLLAWFVDRTGVLVDVVGPYQYVTVTGATDNAGSEWEVSSPTDHANGRHFLCVERRVDPATNRGALVAHAFDHVGNMLAVDVPLVDATTDCRAPSVDSDGARFALVHESRVTPNAAAVVARTVAVIGGQIVSQDSATVAGAQGRDERPVVCARPGTPNGYTFAWTRATGSQWQVQCSLYRGVASASVATRATACGGLGIAHSGALALGETFTVAIDNQTGIGGFLVGLAVNAPIPGCSGCVLGADGVIVLGSQLAVLVPGNPALVGAVVSFQGARFDPALGPCLGALAFSDTLDAVVQ